jgi:hypothetical protein
MLIASETLENMEGATRNGQSIDRGSIAQKETTSIPNIIKQPTILEQYHSKKPLTPCQLWHSRPNMYVVRHLNFILYFHSYLLAAILNNDKYGIVKSTRQGIRFSTMYEQNAYFCIKKHSKILQWRGQHRIIFPMVNTHQEGRNEKINYKYGIVKSTNALILPDMNGWNYILYDNL